MHRDRDDNPVPRARGVRLIRVAIALAGIRLLCARLRPRRTRPAAEEPLRYLGPASVIVAAFNEAATIAGTVRSIIGNEYPGVEVIVVDDGSTDGTANIVDALGLPGVFVLRQGHTGRPDAVRNGISYARHDLLVLVKSGTILEHDAIGRLLQRFNDPAVGVIAGRSRIEAFRRSAVPEVYEL